MPRPSSTMIGVTANRSATTYSTGKIISRNATAMQSERQHGRDEHAAAPVGRARRTAVADVHLVAQVRLRGADQDHRAHEREGQPAAQYSCHADAPEQFAPRSSSGRRPGSASGRRRRAGASAAAGRRRSPSRSRTARSARAGSGTRRRRSRWETADAVREWPCLGRERGTDRREDGPRAPAEPVAGQRAAPAALPDGSRRCGLGSPATSTSSSRSRRFRW